MATFSLVSETIETFLEQVATTVLQNVHKDLLRGQSTLVHRLGDDPEYVEIVLSFLADFIPCLDESDNQLHGLRVLLRGHLLSTPLHRSKELLPRLSVPL